MTRLHRPRLDFDPKARRQKACSRPDGTIDSWATPRRRIDNTMIKAIARAFRWREMLENGIHTTIAESILNGRQPVDITMAILKR